jgi:competence ComEA-like helix-hairpin-helix protein
MSNRPASAVATNRKPSGAKAPAAPAETPDADSPEESWGWTRPQRWALWGLLSLLLVFLTIQYVRRPYRLDEPIAVRPGADGPLELGIDPNTAQVAELACLPQLGEKLALAIVNYRDLHRDASGVAFENIEDLDRVPGIGKKTLENLRPYLMFPGDATRPANIPTPKGLTNPRVIVETQPSDR